MAVIKLSPFTTGISGSMKNLSFSTDGENTIMKERETPANPKSSLQVAQRGYFSRASKGYAALSAGQLALWREWAKGQLFVGKKGKKPYAPNAFQAYASLANKFYEANAGVGTAPTSPPTSAFAGDVVTLSAVASANKVTISSSGANASNVVTEIWLQPLKNANRKPSAGAYRVKAYFPFAAGSLSLPIPVAPGYYAAQARFVNKLSGQAGPMIPLAVTGMALALEDGGADEAAPAAAAKAKKAA